VFARAIAGERKLHAGLTKPLPLALISLCRSPHMPRRSRSRTAAFAFWVGRRADIAARFRFRKSGLAAARRRAPPTYSSGLMMHDVFSHRSPFGLNQGRRVAFTCSL
jgi:hypothetical protein